MSRHERWDVNSGAGLTALAAAAGRAVESSRPDRLMDDPLAAAFVAAARSPVPMPVRWPGKGEQLSDQEILLLYGAGYVGVRSRYFDDQVRGACAGGVRQVVLLAAGLDTRAFRLDWPAGVRLFEVDQPKVLEFKDTVLRERGTAVRCTRTTVAADLREDWEQALRDAGFDTGVPTAWLAEGLLQYLPAEAERALFARIHVLSASGSRLVVERSVNLAALAGAADGARLREVGDRTGIAMDELIDTGARPDPAAWLTEHGWTVTEEQVTRVAERYQRDLADPGLPRPTALPYGGSGPAARSVHTSFLSARLDSARPDSTRVDPR